MFKCFCHKICEGGVGLLAGGGNTFAAVQQANTSLEILFLQISNIFNPEGMKGAWAWYQAQLTVKPVRTQIVTSGILWAIGDLVAQSVSASVEKQKHSAVLSAPPLPHGLPSSQVKPVRNDGLDWKRAGISSMFGVGFVGPVGHFWYEGLERLVNHRLRLKHNSLGFLATKLAADAFIFGPIHLMAFFTYSGLAMGKSWVQVKQDLRRDFLPAFMTEGAAWPVVQVVNFRFVPVQHQLLYVNLFCLLDSAFLSWFKHQDDAAWKRKLNALFGSGNHKD